MLVDLENGWFGAPHEKFRFLNDLEATGVRLVQSRDLATQRLGPKFAPNISYVHFALALSLAQQGELAQARARFDVGVKLDPTSWLAEFVRGDIALQADNPKEAIEHLHRCLSFQPDYPAIHHLLGQAYEKHGELKEALREYRIYLDQADDPEIADRDRQAAAMISARLENQ